MGRKMLNGIAKAMAANMMMSGITMFHQLGSGLQKCASSTTWTSSSAMSYPLDRRFMAASRISFLAFIYARRILGAKSASSTMAPKEMTSPVSIDVPRWRTGASSTQATFVGPYMTPIAANHLCHRAANRKGTSRLGKSEALLGEHTLRFALAGGSTASKFHHTQSHYLLRLLTETRRRERKFHPRGEHANHRDRGVQTSGAYLRQHRIRSRCPMRLLRQSPGPS